VAKDRIGIQITVLSPDPALQHTLEEMGYSQMAYLTDHVPAGSAAPAAEWAKWVFEPPGGQRPANVHVRIEGR
jgi:hypothetical protein